MKAKHSHIFAESAVCTDCRYKLSLLRIVEQGFVALRFAMRWNVKRVFEAFIPTVGTEDTEHVRLWNQIGMVAGGHGCRD
jgi:hypothetical protein